MSERYNVAASAVLGENYEITNIECSDYNPSIDGNITVTITVNDVYGDAISGENVTVTVSEGTFTQLNGSDITSDSTVTGTTNSSGQFTLTYSCSEWGLITFSANNKSTQIHVTGWKEVQNMYATKLKVFRNNQFYKLRLNGSFTVANGTGNTDFATMNSSYAPPNNITAWADGQNKIVIYTSGVIRHIKQISDTQTSKTIENEIIYSK